MGADAMADPTAEDVPLPPAKPVVLPNFKPKPKARSRRKW
jgi:hypothetical protein